jgi:ribonuclease-3 family protein
MINGFFENLEKFNIENKNVNSISPLVLAYVGDTVYEIFIRTRLVSKFKCSPHKLHLKAVEYVSANAQSDIVRNISDNLTENEKYLLKRGRNAKSGSIPKNTSIIDYKYATGFESLIGFLYLKNDFNRLTEIINLSIDYIENKSK